MSFEVSDMLKQRANRYGSYETHSEYKETIVRKLQKLPNWDNCNSVVRQGAIMIIDKLVRAFNGDPNYDDNWVDIQGYAKLVQNYIDEQSSPDCGTCKHSSDTSICETCVSYKNYEFGRIVKITSNTSALEDFVDPRDGKVYKTVKIGNQVWMAENLAYDAEGSKCYDNNPANGQKYGRLYDWETAMKACPPGWHLPSDEEWQTLIDYVDDRAGIKLKSISGWNTNVDHITGTDVYGFSALPGGYGYSYGNFLNVGDYGYWWSSSEYNSRLAYNRLMSYYYELVNYNYDKSYLFSVRCLRDI